MQVIFHSCDFSCDTVSHIRETATIVRKTKHNVEEMNLELRDTESNPKI